MQRHWLLFAALASLASAFLPAKGRSQARPGLRLRLAASAGPSEARNGTDSADSDFTREFFESVKEREGGQLTEEKDIYNALRERMGFGVEEEFARVRQQRIEGKNVTGDLDASEELLKATLRAMEQNIAENATAGQLPDIKLPTSPDPALTPGLVVMSILQAMRCNDSPYENHGIEVLTRFTSSASSATDTDEPSFRKYCDFIPKSEYGILLKWDAIRFKPLEKAGKKALQKIQLRLADSNEWVTVKFALSERTTFLGETWLLDSFLIARKN